MFAKPWIEGRGIVAAIWVTIKNSTQGTNIWNLSARMNTKSLKNAHNKMFKMTTRTRKRVKFNFTLSEGPEAPNAYEGAGRARARARARALSTRTYIDNWRVLRWFHIHSSTFKTCLKNLWKSAKPTDFRGFRRGQLLDPPICTMWVSEIWSNLLNLALLKLIKTDQN